MVLRGKNLKTEFWANSPTGVSVQKDKAERQSLDMKPQKDRSVTNHTRESLGRIGRGSSRELFRMLNCQTELGFLLVQN
jgi:hypothetical protein